MAVNENRARPARELLLNILFGVLGVLLLQVGFTVTVISLASGGGSFVGLGALLCAVVGIPLTALINALVIYASRKGSGSPYILRVTLISSVLPVVQLALVVLVTTLRL